MDRATGRSWLSALAQPVTYLGFTMLVLLYAGLAYLLYADQQHDEREALRQGGNLCRLFEQFVSRSFKAADNTILLLRRSYRQDPVNTDLVAWATDPELKNDLTFNFSIIGPDGRIKSSSYGPRTIGIDVRNREHFLVHLGSTKDDLYVSKPVALRTSGTDTILLSRRLSKVDGSFDGVVTASFDIAQLETFYKSLDLGPDGLLALIGLDGVIRAAGANGQSRLDLIGRALREAPVLKAAERSSSGSYWNHPDPSINAERVDAERRLMFYRRVEGFPFVVTVGISERMVFEQANANARIYWAIAVVLTLGILIAIAIGAVREQNLIATRNVIVRQANSDGLTGLANRTSFVARLDRALLERNNTGVAFNIFVLDLDNFKGINDTLGHPAGDNLIRQLALRLQSTASRTDAVARLGGDEFAILQMVDDDETAAAVERATRLLQLISEPFDLNGYQAIVETSIGIAHSSMCAESTEQLIKNADLALYHAKAAGRNTFRIFEARMADEARQRYEIEIDLRNAIGNNEFETYYQPIVDVRSEQICAVEALLRWHHPKRGTILPGTFISIAESTGLIEQIGERVLLQACQDAVRWPAPIKLAVNLSSIQFRKGDIVAVVAAALAASGLAPERLELEITESVLLPNDQSNLGKLYELKTLGASIVLDDFGTGYSSLSYLQTFPFDKIKIDRSFIAGIANADCAAIVCAVSGLARSLNMTTTAEGVEWAAQLTLLRAAGCDQAQGYLFGRPCPASELGFEPAVARDNRAVA